MKIIKIKTINYIYLKQIQINNILKISKKQFIICIKEERS